MSYAVTRKKRAGILPVPPEQRQSDEAKELCGLNCGSCGLEFQRGYRPDPCIGGYLPGVAHACCGHGETAKAYVAGGPGCEADQPMFTVEGDWTIRGRAAIEYIDRHRHLATETP